MTVDALDARWAELTAHLEQLGVPVYPGLPDTDYMPVADWPDTNWTAFLDLACQVGVPLLYARAHRVTAERIQALRDAAADLEAASGAQPAAPDIDLDGDDAVVEPEDAPPVLLDADATLRRWRDAAASAAVGAVGQIEVGFVVAGVLHLWSDESAGYGLLSDAEREAAEVSEQLREIAAAREARASRFGDAFRRRLSVAREGERLLRELKPQVEKWSQQLLTADRYLGGPSQQARARLAGEVIPELGRWRELTDRDEVPQSWARHRAAWSAYHQAEEQLPALKDQRLTALRDRLGDVAVTVATAPEFAARRTKQVRRQYVRDVVTAELGFPSAELTDLLLERADEARSH